MNLDFLGYFYILGIILGPVAIGTVIAFFLVRKKFKWSRLQLLTVFLPFIFHFILASAGQKFYGMEGYINEAFVLSCSIGFFVAISALFVEKTLQRKPVVDLLVSFLLVLLFYIFFPESVGL